jgi:DNA polymerase/3'-5' exonuclease PolX
MSKTDDLADVMEEFATYLELDGQEGRAHAYDRAARALRKRRFVPPDPSDIDNVGPSIRTKIAQYQRAGEIEELSALKDEYSWFAELKQVDGVGPSRAEQLHQKFNIETVDDLIFVGEDITLLPRVGQKRARNILNSAHEVRDDG